MAEVIEIGLRQVTRRVDDRDLPIHHIVEAERVIAVAVDRGSILSGVLAVGSWKVAEDALPRQRRQNCAHERLFKNVALFVNQGEEKGFVLDDRPTDTSAKLVPVFDILGDPIEVIEPLAGIEGGVAQELEEAAVQVVGSRLVNQVDDSAAAAPELG